MIAALLVIAFLALHHPHSCTPSVTPDVVPEPPGARIPIAIDGATVRLSCRL